MAAEDLISYLKLLNATTMGGSPERVSRGLPIQKRLAEAKQKLESQGYDLRNIEKSFVGAGKNAAKVGSLSIDLAKDIRMGNMGRANTLFNEIKKLGGNPASVVDQFTLPAERRDVIKFGNPKSATEAMDSRIGESFIEGTPETARQTNVRRAKEQPSTPSAPPAVEEKAPAPAISDTSKPVDYFSKPEGKPTEVDKTLLDEVGRGIEKMDARKAPATATDMEGLYKGKPIVAVADEGPAFSSPKEPVAEPAKVDSERALALFQNTHGGPFDPKSSVDKGKMEAIQNLMAKKGSEKLSPNQFSLQIYRQSK